MRGITRASLAAIALSVVVSAGCGGPGHVRFDRDSCYIDGRVASLQAVEEHETQVQHRIASRQPWLVAITVAIVALAGIGYVERLLLLFSVNRDTRSMGDRLKAIVIRYRTHPVRYFAMVGGSVGLLLTAGVLYIYLDADKRSSERALGTLQFCHLALRTVDEKKTLDDQRQNLASIHQTAGEIRQLIDKLPPAEQAKAQEIVGHMDDAVRRQGRSIADRLQRSEDTAESIRDGTISIERGLSGLQSELGELRELPARVHAIGDALHGVESHGVATEQTLAEVSGKIAAVQKSLDGLSNRPPPSCPACVCGRAALASTAPHADGSAN